MKLQNINGKKLLTAKDAQGKLLFSGPVETKKTSTKCRPTFVSGTKTGA
jgi:hypothetical protein